MKKTIALIIAASSLILAGCCTTRQQATKWDYLIIPGRVTDRPSLNDKLQKAAADGWEVVAAANEAPAGWVDVILRRPK